jgi:hypothetical protein
MEQVELGDIRLFSEMRWRFIKATLLAKLAQLLGYPQAPLNLDCVIGWMGLAGVRDLGLGTVALSHIVGAQGNCIEFDRAFRPRMGGMLQAEWEAAGHVLLQSSKLPVLRLYQWGEAFFVLNGHDEVLVSVLKALGHKQVRAYVIGPETALTPPPTITLLEQWECLMGRRNT